MDADEAAELIGEMHYFPNWMIRIVEDDWLPEHMVDHVVIVDFQIETWDTDRENALKGYPEKTVLARTRQLDVSEVEDEFGLWAMVFAVITEIEMHERREAFRVGTKMDSPFHPHRLSGDKNWKRLTTEVES